MRQIDDSDLKFILGFELKRLSPSTLKGIASGHQDTRDRATRAAADSIAKRMAGWEILVPEPQSNIFADDPLNSGVNFRFPTKG